MLSKVSKMNKKLSNLHCQGYEKCSRECKVELNINLSLNSRDQRN